MASASFDSRELAWAYLARVFEGPSAAFKALLEVEHDVEKIAYAIKNREVWLGSILEQTATRYDWNRSHDDLKIMEELGGRLITPDDPEWPTDELSSAFNYAKSGANAHILQHKSDALEPQVLWVRGENLGALAAQSVSFVGTRAVSSYGTTATRDLVSGLVSKQ